MNIVNELPFDYCSRCKNLDVCTDEQDLYADGEIVDRKITIGCSNKEICINAIKEQIDKVILNGERNGCDNSTPLGRY